MLFYIRLNRQRCCCYCTAGEGSIDSKNRHQTCLSAGPRTSRWQVLAGNEMAGQLLYWQRTSIWASFCSHHILSNCEYIGMGGPVKRSETHFPLHGTISSYWVLLIRINVYYTNLGVLIADEKTEGPSTCLTVLGIEIDTKEMTLRLPMEKLDRLQALLKFWQGRCSGTRRDLESLAGLLQLPPECLELDEFSSAAFTNCLPKLHILSSIT